MSGAMKAASSAQRASLKSLLGVLLGLGLPLTALSCRGSGAVPGYVAATGGDPRSGQRAVEGRHCGVCHDIPDVTGAHGVVGPSLEGFGRRSFIPGGLPNAPGNLIAWIRVPQQIDPRAAMPALGLAENEARDVAAYLYTLR